MSNALLGLKSAAPKVSKADSNWHNDRSLPQISDFKTRNLKLQKPTFQQCKITDAT
jgi:hypothetical protein